MRQRKCRGMLIGLAAAMAVAGCGGGAPESLAFTEGTPEVAPPGEGALSPAEETLVAFHADWLCELERRTFTSLDASESLLDESLRAADIERSTYDEFVAETLTQQHIRDAVLFEHLQLCLPN